MEKKLLVGIFFIKLCLTVVIVAQVGSIIPYKGDPPYRDITESYGLGQSATSLANFDGAHYLNIAREGYHQYDQAFFPLFPMAIRATAVLFDNNHLIAGLIIANTTSLFGVLFLYEVFTYFFGTRRAFMATVFFLLYPASFFLHTVYSEGLFLLLTTAGIYSIITKHFWYATILGFLGGLTRLVGIFSSIIFVGSTKSALSLKKIHPSILFAVFAPLGGLITYMIYLYSTTGDPFFFLTSQTAFSMGRSTHIILLPQVYVRYIKIFITATKDIVYTVAGIEFMLFNLMFLTALVLTYRGYVQKKNAELFFGIFSVFHLLLPTLTGTLLSIPRFGIFSFASFIFFAQIKQKYLAYGLGVIFVILQITMVSLFVQGYFVS